jgi:hypothetical protein
MDDLNRKQGAIIGPWAIIGQLGLEVPHPVVRSELVAGTRKTRITSTQILEQYPRVYQPAHGIIGQLRFALRYEPLDIGVYKAAFARIEKKRARKLGSKRTQRDFCSARMVFI